MYSGKIWVDKIYKSGLSLPFHIAVLARVRGEQPELCCVWLRPMPGLSDRAMIPLIPALMNCCHITQEPGLSVAINRITRTCPIMSWPGTCHGVIQSNHFTPEQHFDASEDYWTTTGSVVKLSPGLMFQRGYLSHERDQSADGETIRTRSSWD